MCLKHSRKSLIALILSSCTLIDLEISIFQTCARIHARIALAGGFRHVPQHVPISHKGEVIGPVSQGQSYRRYLYLYSSTIFTKQRLVWIIQLLEHAQNHKQLWDVGWSANICVHIIVAEYRYSYYIAMRGLGVRRCAMSCISLVMLCRYWCWVTPWLWLVTSSTLVSCVQITTQCSLQFLCVCSCVSHSWCSCLL